MEREQEKLILRDLQKKMVLITGPRQVGKTYLANQISAHYQNPVYLNHDSYSDREIIRKEAWSPDADLLILDEIHKMPDWKTRLKGIYDTRNESQHLLVTGSARLETFRKTGESLAGRYFLHRLLPLSPREAREYPLSRFIDRGGFPDPFLAENDNDASRWRMQYVDGLIREDVLDFERIHDLKAMRLTFELLRRRVGSPVSYNSIARDVDVSPNTVKKYVEILEALYIVFQIRPFESKIARSLKKEPKIYFYDSGLVIGEEGIKLENCVAVSLLKQAYSLEDETGQRARLAYLRTKEEREVDFCFLINEKPQYILEAKKSGTDVSSQLIYFSEKYSLSAVQLVMNLRHEFQEGSVSVRSAQGFLRELPRP
jgi:uncharacterized protein